MGVPAHATPDRRRARLTRRSRYPPAARSRPAPSSTTRARSSPITFAIERSRRSTSSLASYAPPAESSPVSRPRRVASPTVPTYRLHDHTGDDGRGRRRPRVTHPAAGLRSPVTTPPARSARQGRGRSSATSSRTSSAEHSGRRSPRPGVPVAAAASILGHSVEVNHGAYVKAHRDALERDHAREALVELGLGVTAR